MPSIKIENIISFSSEDSVHLCSNILSSDSSKKWKCQTPGEKSAVVVLQLEKASVITAIDIGNEHSAFIEVLVSRSGTSNDYKVFLVMSSFMTPIESRASQNVNKVRMFTKDQFSKPECDEKWDRIKIVCTQPFNKHVQYGLSFVKLQTSEKDSSSASTSRIGKFTIRPESPESFSAGSLFNKRKEMKQEDKLTGAAAIRDAMRESASPVYKPKLISVSTSKKDSCGSSEGTPKGQPRNRNELLYTKDEEEHHEKIDKLIEKKIEEINEEDKVKESQSTPKLKKIAIYKKDIEKRPKTKDESGKPSDSKRKDSIPENTPSTSKKGGNENGKYKALDILSNSNRSEKEHKRKHDHQSNEQTNKKMKTSTTKPFSQLLEDVILVISGIQNPDRSNLRTQALAMGAKYKSEWDNKCTHLICAFVNTPKFNQVKGKGKIVKKSWIEDCYSQRKRLPWRRYALDRNDNGEESEEEICEQVDPGPPTEVNSTVDDEYIEEGSDTEERIARILEKTKENGSIYDADTDEEMLDFSKTRSN